LFRYGLVDLPLPAVVVLRYCRVYDFVTAFVYVYYYLFVVCCVCLRFTVYIVTVVVALLLLLRCYCLVCYTLLLLLLYCVTVIIVIVVIPLLLLLLYCYYCFYALNYVYVGLRCCVVCSFGVLPLIMLRCVRCCLIYVTVALRSHVVVDCHTRYVPLFIPLLFTLPFARCDCYWLPVCRVTFTVTFTFTFTFVTVPVCYRWLFTLLRLVVLRCVTVCALRYNVTLPTFAYVAFTTRVTHVYTLRVCAFAFYVTLLLPIYVTITLLRCSFTLRLRLRCVVYVTFCCLICYVTHVYVVTTLFVTRYRYGLRCSLFYVYVVVVAVTFDFAVRLPFVYVPR